MNEITLTLFTQDVWPGMFLPPNADDVTLTDSQMRGRLARLYPPCVRPRETRGLL